MNNRLEKGLTLGNRAYYEKHLEIINVFLEEKLVKKEIEVLACFFSLDKKLIKDEVFNTKTRKIVRGELKLTPGGLGNHFTNLVKKKYLIRDEVTNKMTPIASLVPKEEAQDYFFTLTIDETDK